MTKEAKFKNEQKFAKFLNQIQGSKNAGTEKWVTGKYTAILPAYKLSTKKLNQLLYEHGIFNKRFLPASRFYIKLKLTSKSISRFQ